MRVRLAAALCATLLLAGCSLPNLSNLLSFSDNSDATFPGDKQAAAPRAVASVAPAPGAQSAPDPFCAAVAQQEAQQDGFDGATQQRMAMRGYQQCMVMYRGQ